MDAYVALLDVSTAMRALLHVFVAGAHALPPVVLDASYARVLQHARSLRRIHLVSAPEKQEMSWMAGPHAVKRKTKKEVKVPEQHRAWLASWIEHNRETLERVDVPASFFAFHDVYETLAGCSNLVALPAPAFARPDANVLRVVAAAPKIQHLTLACRTDPQGVGESQASWAQQWLASVATQRIAQETAQRVLAAGLPLRTLVLEWPTEATLATLTPSPLSAPSCGGSKYAARLGRLDLRLRADPRRLSALPACLSGLPQLVDLSVRFDYPRGHDMAIDKCLTLDLPKVETLVWLDSPLPVLVAPRLVHLKAPDRYHAAQCFAQCPALEQLDIRAIERWAGAVGLDVMLSSSASMASLTRLRKLALTCKGFEDGDDSGMPAAAFGQQAAGGAWPNLEDLDMTLRAGATETDVQLLLRNLPQLVTASIKCNVLVGVGVADAPSTAVAATAGVTTRMARLAFLSIALVDDGPWLLDGFTFPALTELVLCSPSRLRRLDRILARPERMPVLRQLTLDGGGQAYWRLGVGAGAALTPIASLQTVRFHDAGDCTLELDDTALMWLFKCCSRLENVGVATMADPDTLSKQVVAAATAIGMPRLSTLSLRGANSDHEWLTLSGLISLARACPLLTQVDADAHTFVESAIEALRLRATAAPAVAVEDGRLGGVDLGLRLLRESERVVYVDVRGASAC